MIAECFRVVTSFEGGPLPGEWCTFSDGVLAFSAAAIAGSALWFIYLQLFVLKAMCPYCMTGHVLGLLLVVILIWRLQARRLWTGAVGQDLGASNPTGFGPRLCFFGRQ